MHDQDLIDPPVAKSRRGDILDLTVTDLAYGGRGISHLPDGRIVFIERALPGDVAQVVLTKAKSSFAEGYARSIIEPSAQRVEAPCPAQEVCGGCVWQTLDYQAQASAKRSQFAEALRHIGGIDHAVEDIVTTDRRLGYRNKMEFSFGDGPDGELLLGLHERKSYWRIVEAEECLLPTKRMDAVRTAILEVASESGLPPWHNRRNEGFWRNLIVREGHGLPLDESPGLLVDIVTGAGELPVDRILEALSPLRPATALWSISSQVSSTRVDETRLLLGDGQIVEAIGDTRFRLSARSFFQTNTLMARTLYDVVADLAGLTGTERVLDLYCGIGSIGLYLSSRCASILGIESVDSAVDDARRNAAMNGIDKAEYLCGEAESVLPQVIADGDRFDVAIVDPPRSGLHPRTLHSLIESRAPQIVYVSCNPTTLARDLAVLVEAGYQVERAVPVDMFPQTYHIEGVVSLKL